MKHPSSVLVLAALAAGLAGCSSYSVSSIMGDDSPSVAQAHTAPDLSMPPDLQLHPPGQAVASNNVDTTATAAAAPVMRQESAAPAVLPSARPAGTDPDIYAQYGISKTKPDGTAKTAEELRLELRKAIVAKKQQQNPNYGTIFNIGNIFSDG